MDDLDAMLPMFETPTDNTVLFVVIGLVIMCVLCIAVLIVVVRCRQNQGSSSHKKTAKNAMLEMTTQGKQQVNTKQGTHRRLLTNEGVEYFEDVENRTTSWTLPPNGVIAVEASAAGSRHYRLETEDGVEYFVDVDRSTTSWVLPDNGIVVKANDVKTNGVNPMMYHNKKRSLSEIAQQIDLQQKTHRRLLTNEGVEYFEDVENRTTSWTLPPNGVIAVEASAAGSRHYRLETEDGVEYFVDVDRSTTSWVLPDNGIVVKANDVKTNGVNPMMYHNKKRSLSEIAQQIDLQQKTQQKETTFVVS